MKAFWLFPAEKCSGVWLYKLQLDQTWLTSGIKKKEMKMRHKHAPYCIVSYRIVSYCIVLYWSVKYYIVQYCIVLYCIVLYQDEDEGLAVQHLQILNV
jgi:hypothetical protein